MFSTHAWPGHWARLLDLVGGSLAVIGLVACGGPGSPLAVSERVPTFGPTVTEAASVTPVPATPMLNAKELASLH